MPMISNGSEYKEQEVGANMQDIKSQIEDAQKRQQEVVEQINALEQQRQLLLQEALRIDGELRVLRRMDGHGK